MEHAIGRHRSVEWCNRSATVAAFRFRDALGGETLVEERVAADLNTIGVQRGSGGIAQVGAPQAEPAATDLGGLEADRSSSRSSSGMTRPARTMTNNGLRLRSSQLLSCVSERTGADSCG
jgi:hypothetical protein